MAVAKLFSDAVHTWFSDPRAIVQNGSLYTCFVRRSGNVVIGKVNLTTKVRTTFTLHADFEVDDHDNPALIFRPDGKIAAFYSKHNDTTGVRCRISTNAEDINDWATASTVPDMTPTGVDNGTSYVNPFSLSDEADRLYLFFRGANRFPVVVTSDDWDSSSTPTWSTPREIFTVAGESPYLKYAADGAGRIHFLAATGHPNVVASGACHVYHWYYDASDANFHTSDGTVIRSFASLATTGALTVSEVTKVYDATTHSGGGNGNAWPWSLELDGSGNPVGTLGVYNSSADNRYFYVRWDGSAWARHTMLTGEASIYAVPASEPQYAGGAVVDPNDTSVVWVSSEASGQWEIEKWQTANNGSSWSTTAITSGSSSKNARPVVPRNRTGAAPDVMWWRGTYTTYTTFDTDLMASPGLFGPSYRELVAADAPVVYLYLDETSGTNADAAVGTDGTYVNTPTLDQTGAIIVGRAVTFNGTSQRVDLSDLSAAEGSFTYEAWFKSSSSSSDRWIVSESSTTSNNPLAGLILHSGTIRGFLRGDGGTLIDVVNTVSGPHADDNQWHHGAVTWDGTTLKLYFDGRFVQSGTGTPGTRTLNRSTVAAVRRAAIGQWFLGTVDEPAVYTRALAADEINSHFEAYEAEAVTSDPVSLVAASAVGISPTASATATQGVATAVGITPTVGGGGTSDPSGTGVAIASGIVPTAAKVKTPPHTPNRPPKPPPKGTTTAPRGTAIAIGIAPGQTANLVATMGTAVASGISPTAVLGLGSGTAVAQGVSPATRATSSTGSAIASGVSPSHGARVTAVVVTATGISPTDSFVPSTPVPGVAVGQGVTPSAGRLAGVGTATATGISPTSSMSLTATLGVAVAMGISPTDGLTQTATMGTAAAVGFSASASALAGSGAALALGTAPSSSAVNATTTGLAVATGVVPTITRPPFRVSLTPSTRGAPGLTPGVRDALTLTPSTRSALTLEAT